MNLEPISERNLKDLVRLKLELWPACVWAEEYENVQRILGSDRETCILALDRGKYIAFIYVSVRTEHVEGARPGPVAYIEGIYVDAAYRKSGLGKRLFQTGQAWGKEKGCKQMGSDVHIDNLNSIDFHKKIGFEEADRVVCFIKEIDGRIKN